MNVSSIGSDNPYTSTKIMHPPATQVKRAEDKQLFDKGLINEGLINDIDTKRAREEARIQERNNLLTEYSDYITDRKYTADSLDSIYKRAMELFKRIDDSTDDDSTKSWKRALLEEIVKSETGCYVAEAFVRIHIPFFYNGVKLEPEKETTRIELSKSLMNSAKRLTLNFLDFMRHNKNASYDDMVKYVNKDAPGKKDINSISLQEFSEFAEHIGSLEHGHIKSSLDIASGYFSVLGDGATDAELDCKWSQKEFNSGIYDKYGKVLQIWRF